ncbi:hypothetical protein MTR62_07270 [Novosphingobium sp. 1949]|uniref:Uncharacterized protein n=1 Tax=Novosphingobium organovorum TaxID=2930092 RepID=A0ABT0BCF7_9SPHN|nr:hypothetical protein [Novosphingobium organovorum]MCJ2182491.1 hypothetical protein [Novosphingobium organovorum]
MPLAALVLLCACGPDRDDPTERARIRARAAAAEQAAINQDNERKRTQAREEARQAELARFYAGGDPQSESAMPPQQEADQEADAATPDGQPVASTTIDGASIIDSPTPAPQP